MGNWVSLYYSNPKYTPKWDEPPQFDPNLGFPNGRKERVMIATQAEMESAKIPLAYRDYCAHLLIDLQACRKEVWPIASRCAHEHHAYMQCQYEDYILRMKEYEREKRLLRMKQAKDEKLAREELAA